jgi:hypothetical protein
MLFGEVQPHERNPVNQTLCDRQHDQLRYCRDNRKILLQNLKLQAPEPEGF